MGKKWGKTWVRDASTQTKREINYSKDRDAKENEDIVLAMLEDAMRPGAGAEEFLKIMNLKWPVKSFRKFTLEKNDIFEIPREWDLATMVPRDLDRDMGFNKRIREHYQGLEELRKQETAVGEVAYLITLLELHQSHKIVIISPIKVNMESFK